MRVLQLLLLLSVLVAVTLALRTKPEMRASPTPTQLLEGLKWNGGARAYKAFNDAIYSENFGDANIEFGKPVTNATRYPIASNTKLLSAISLYQLQERGLVNVTDSIADYLNQTDFAAMGYPRMTAYCPKVKGNASCQTVTFVQLMDMTAGIPVNPAEQFGPYASAALTVGSTIATELLFVPGTDYYYSNPSFNIVGYFVAKFSGLTLRKYYETHIFKPLGMADSYYDAMSGQFQYDANLITPFTQFFSMDDSKTLLGSGRCIPFNLGSTAGAGGAVSTPTDEMKLYFTLFNFSAPQSKWGQPLFSRPESLLAVIKPRVTMPNSSFSFYAQGIVVQFVTPTAKSSGVPDVILYEGSTTCTTTANVYIPAQPSVPSSSAIMTQAWSTAPAYFVNSTVYPQLDGYQLGEVDGLMSVLEKRGLAQGRPSASVVASKLLLHFFPRASSLVDAEGVANIRTSSEGPKPMKAVRAATVNPLFEALFEAGDDAPLLL